MLCAVLNVPLSAGVMLAGDRRGEPSREELVFVDGAWSSVGSKAGVGVVAFCSYGQKHWAISSPVSAHSVLQVELLAIKTALDFLASRSVVRVVVHTDSAHSNSTLQSPSAVIKVSRST